MKALVPHKVLLAGEAFLAERALVGPLPGVQPAMGGQVFLADKGLPTFAAGKGSLAGVDHLVAQEVGVVVEAPPAFATDVGTGLPACRMCPLVKAEVDLQAEALLAFSTCVRALARVPQAMFAQAGLMWEAAPAFGAAVKLGLWLQARGGALPTLRQSLGVSSLVQRILLLV